jgi:hypothetical protein
MQLTDPLQPVRMQPFRPFRNVPSDGTTYDVRQRNFVMVGVGSAVVGVPADENEDLYRVTHQIALQHILRQEPFEESAVAYS